MASVHLLASLYIWITKIDFNYFINFVIAWTKDAPDMHPTLPSSMLLITDSKSTCSKIFCTPWSLAIHKSCKTHHNSATKVVVHPTFFANHIFHLSWWSRRRPPQVVIPCDDSQRSIRIQAKPTLKRRVPIHMNFLFDRISRGIKLKVGKFVVLLVMIDLFPRFAFQFLYSKLGMSNIHS